MLQETTHLRELKGCFYKRNKVVSIIMKREMKKNIVGTFKGKGQQPNKGKSFAQYYKPKEERKGNEEQEKV